MPQSRSLTCALAHVSQRGLRRSHEPHGVGAEAPVRARPPVRLCDAVIQTEHELQTAVRVRGGGQRCGHQCEEEEEEEEEGARPHGAQAAVRALILHDHCACTDLSRMCIYGVSRAYPRLHLSLDVRVIRPPESACTYRPVDQSPVCTLDSLRPVDQSPVCTLDSLRPVDQSPVCTLDSPLDLVSTRLENNIQILSVNMKQKVKDLDSDDEWILEHEVRGHQSPVP
uniref:Uncharacterized protein n=1 Tax=Knipowitschia caucasica TaxID=637954 RepID=A0AAV2KIN7_KNICA